MKPSQLLTPLLALSLLSGMSHAGQEIASKTVVEPPKRTWFPEDPAGSITLGGQFSEGATGVYVDSITGLWAPQSRNAFLFLNTRAHWEDNDQFISSTGLGFRAMCPQHEIIVGVNAYWDALHGAGGSDFNQLGLGAEILTHWVDARFNHYAPDNDRTEIGRSSSRQSSTSLGPEFNSGAFISRNQTETTRRRSFRSYEAALEGYNAEIGFLIPGLDRFAEVRVFGGYYHYDNPFGSDYEGFKARLEARLLPGVIADVEYWDDAALMGGHWTAGARVSVPFSIYNLVTGRNPFEGIGDSFTPRQREFRERMSDMVIRSHRIQTAGSGAVPAGDSTSMKVTTVPVRPAFQTAAQTGGGGGSLVE